MISHGVKASKQLTLLPQLQYQWSDWLLATSTGTAGSYTGAPHAQTAANFNADNGVHGHF